MTARDRGLIVLALVTTALAGYSVYHHVPAIMARYALPEPMATVVDWEALIDDAPRLGSDSAAHRIVQFVDYACPACRADQVAIDEILRHDQTDVSVTVRFFPFVSPRSAIAARGAWCANKQSRFAEYHRLILALDQLPADFAFHLTSYAEDAGIPDTYRWEDCVNSEEAHSAIESDSSRAAAIGVRGTPTYIVNGSLYESHASRLPRLLSSLRKDSQ